MDPSPLVIPSAPAPPRRTSLPYLAGIVPVGMGVALWLTTGSVQSLWFAALGPLMMLASVADAARTRRHDRRREADRVEAEWRAVEDALARRHAEERAQLESRHPDVAACVAEPPLRGTDPIAADTEMTVGRGVRVSAVRTTGGEGDRAEAFRARCAELDDAPVVVRLGGGVCVRGQAPVAAAAARALVAQLCLRFGPAQLALVGEELASSGLTTAAHAVRARRGAFRVGWGTLGAPVAADAVIWTAAPDAEVPSGITTVLDVVEPGAASLRTPEGVTEVAVECLSRPQAELVASATGEPSDTHAELPLSVPLADVIVSEAGDGLAVVVGRDARGTDIAVDLVEHGPHAIVTGMTGAGKSELLVTWVAAMCAAYGPDRVTFVLADFKGGTAFEPLRALRQVSAVITDLDDEGARRGVLSLRAEMRRREAALAAAGVRDVSEADLPRLVIVVDEFAALLLEHADLGDVFIDIAARGRALGMHLVLGTQRAGGVIRDALAANCPLRISLRVADPADSRAVIGTDGAALLDGGPEGRGCALVRRPQDAEPQLVRVALTGPGDLRRAATRWSQAVPAVSPWLPPLPRRIDLADLRGADHDGSDDAGGDAVVLGLADDPQRQRQPRELLRPGRERGLAVVGAPGSGRTALVRAVAAQRHDALLFPSDAESAVDLLAAWVRGDTEIPELVLCDDIDALHAELPVEYAQEFAQRWEQSLRLSPSTTWILTAARASGPLGRVLDALPRRALLRAASRVEHLAAGGETSGFVRDRPPGRAVLDGREVQFAWADERPRQSAASSTEIWAPARPVVALVTAGASDAVGALRAARPEWDVRTAGSDVPTTASPCILMADAEGWQRQWALWQQIRAEGEVLVRAERPSDLRQLVGVRDLPPFARLHQGRAWSVVGDRAPRRVVVPGLGSR